MNAGNHFSTELAAKICEVAQAALDLQAQHLQLDGVDVAVYASPWVIPELGLSGYAPLGHWMQLTLDPQNPNFAACWERELPPMLAHELHHVRRNQGVGYGSTLLEALVSEGLAQHYEAQARGEPPIYARPLGDLEALWLRAQQEFHSPYDHSSWFFGSPQADLPRWSGYALGFELVGRFMKTHGGDAATHVNTPATAFLSAWDA